MNSDGDHSIHDRWWQDDERSRSLFKAWALGKELVHPPSCSSCREDIHDYDKDHFHIRLRGTRTNETRLVPEPLCADCASGFIGAIPVAVEYDSRGANGRVIDEWLEITGIVAPQQREENNEPRD